MLCFPVKCPIRAFNSGVTDQRPTFPHQTNLIHWRGSRGNLLSNLQCYYSHLLPWTSTQLVSLNHLITPHVYGTGSVLDLHYTLSVGRSRTHYYRGPCVTWYFLFFSRPTLHTITERTRFDCPLMQACQVGLSGAACKSSICPVCSRLLHTVFYVYPIG